MSNETAFCSGPDFAMDSDVQVIEKKPADNVLLKDETVLDNTVEEPSKSNSNEMHYGTITLNEEKELQDLVNMDATGSNTMALLAATYSPTDTVKDETIASEVTYVTLDDDDDDDIPTKSTSSSKADDTLLELRRTVLGLPTRKYKLRPKKKDQKRALSKKKKTRNMMKMLNQKRAEKRERLKLETEQRLELRLNDLIEPEPVDNITPSPPPEDPPMVQSTSTSEDAGYVKAGYRLREGKRPPNYDAETLQQWTAMQDEKRLIREQQKILDFKEEQERIELRRFRQRIAKKAKINELGTENGGSWNLAILNAISESIDNNSDDVKILEVVTKPKRKKPNPPPSFPVRFSLEDAKKRNKQLRVIQPVPPRPKPFPVVCLPSSSIRRAPLHTLPVFTPRNPVIRFPQSIIPQPKKSTFTDDCFSTVPCSSNPSTSSASNNITVPAPIFPTTSKRSQLKKQAAKLNSSMDEEETVFDDCFSTVPCTPSTTLPSTFQPTFTTKPPTNVSSKPSLAKSEVSSPITDDCFTSVPCSNSINANGVNILPQNSTLIVPTSTQQALIPQFATISAPLQLTQQFQTITIPASMLPPPGIPLQLVFILPNASIPPPTNSNNSSASPIISQPETSSNPPSNNAKVIQVKCEMKE